LDYLVLVWGTTALLGATTLSFTIPDLAFLAGGTSTTRAALLLGALTGTALEGRGLTGAALRFGTTALLGATKLSFTIPDLAFLAGGTSMTRAALTGRGLTGATLLGRADTYTMLI
jgi:hypothetical protein